MRNDIKQKQASDLLDLAREYRNLARHASIPEAATVLNQMAENYLAQAKALDPAVADARAGAAKEPIAA